MEAWKCTHTIRKFPLSLCVTLIWIFAILISTNGSSGEKLCDPKDDHEERPQVIPVRPISSFSNIEEEPNELISELLNATNQNATESESLWANLVFRNCTVLAEFWCNAKYPVEWVETYNQDIDELEQTDSKVEKHIWTDRILNKSLLEDPNTTNWPIFDASITSYTTVLKLKYLQSSWCVAANYSCRSVRNPCLQTNVVAVVDKESQIVTYRQSNDFSSSTEITPEAKKCDVMISVSTKFGDLSCPGWRCTSGTHALVDHIYSRTCDSVAHCNTFYVHKKQHCVRRLSPETCRGCLFVNKTSCFVPGFIHCDNEDEQVITAAQYFFSVPQSVNLKTQPELYLDWDEADPQKMLYLEPLPQEEIYMGQRITIYCRVSRYYFSYGHRFALEYLNESMVYSPHIDGISNKVFNFNHMNTSILVNDPALKRIYCFAPVWNSSVWINQSFPVVVFKDPTEPTIVVNGLDDPQPSITFALHQSNARLSCVGKGRPIPQVHWEYERESKLLISEIDVGEGRKDLIFSYVTNPMGGSYKCVAINFRGETTRNVIVAVKDEFLQTVVIVGVVVVTVFLLTVMVSWKKIWKQRRQLRVLTDAEIKEFREGNVERLHNTEFLDTQELLHALPYNDEFEIPIENLRIDRSNVLGSGNFGQVLKGAVTWPGSDRVINVAVKTLKPKHNVLYFKTLLSEVKIMAHIGRHANIVSLVGACTKNIRKQEIYIAVEYCAKGSLEMFLKTNRSSFVNLICNDNIYINISLGNQRTYENLMQQEIMESPGPDDCVSTFHLLKWSREIANGIEFLGSKKIIHGDLAARNVLLTEGLIAKIGDFGLSRQLMEYSNYVRSDGADCVIPWKWMSIETLQEMKFSVSSDVWSYAVTLWEIFTLAQLPYAGVTWSCGFVDHLLNGLRLHKPAYASSQIYNIMLDCWSLDPSHRPTFIELKDFFEALLLQSCNDDYLDTNSTRRGEYINAGKNPHAFNPCYSVVSNGIYNGEEMETMNVGSPLERSRVMKFVNGNYAKIVPVEDTQGYLRPLILESFEEEEEMEK